MNTHHRSESNLNDLSDLDDRRRNLHDSESNDREISLGTSTILGIFFALALVCAVFFGFGYSMGRRSAPPAAILNESAATNSGTSKPAPGSLGPAATQVKEEAPSETATPEVQAQPDSLSGAPADPSSTRPATIARVAPAATASQAAPGAALSIVQVAAVSHQEDAAVLLSALKKRGYTVAVHQVPQDKLLHVQLGPFPSKKDADAMRQRLLSDGYNAIVK